MSLGKSRILAENLNIQSSLYSDMEDESESDVDQVIVEDNDEAQKEGIARKTTAKESKICSRHDCKMLNVTSKGYTTQQKVYFCVWI